MSGFCYPYSRGRFKEVAEYTSFIDNYTDDWRNADRICGVEMRWRSANRMYEKTTTQVRCAGAETGDPCLMMAEARLRAITWGEERSRLGRPGSRSMVIGWPHHAPRGRNSDWFRSGGAA